MNGKRYFLVIRRRWKTLLLSILAGAVLGAGIYAICYAQMTKVRMYRSEAIFYITANEEAAYNLYNDYTWGDVIKSDPIMLPAMETLEKFDSETPSREEIEAAVRANIVSDLRLVIVKVTMDSKEAANQAMAGIAVGMEGFSDYVNEFDAITLWSLKEATPVVHENLILQAVLLGIVLSLILWLIAITVYYAVEDSIYVISDVEEVTDLPVLGIRCKKENEILKRLLEENLLKCGNPDELSEVSVDNEAEWDISSKRDKKVVLLIKFGHRNRQKLLFLLNQLKLEQISVAGVVITDADNSFMRNYYQI